jgi:LmbE family N-acetylglucosaminyl deacetylase
MTDWRAIFAADKAILREGKGPAMSDQRLSILVFGAHPDDCDFRAGGLALKYRALGHSVRFVSLTNGDTGHYRLGGGPLAKRRYDEAQAAAAVAGIRYDIMDIHNGELEVNVPNRKLVIQIMRDARPDLVLCHRPWDYHPDHRAVGTLVQDAAYTVTVPNVAPLTPHLPRPPVVGYVWDSFRRPVPFEATVAVDIGDVMERKIDMIHCHTSQMYEWLPFNDGCLDKAPTGDAERRAWLAVKMRDRFRKTADACRETVRKWYGPERGDRVEFAEAVEISEYGAPMPEADAPRLFPFLP